MEIMAFRHDKGVALFSNAVLMKETKKLNSGVRDSSESSVRRLIKSEFTPSHPAPFRYPLLLWFLQPRASPRDSIGHSTYLKECLGISVIHFVPAFGKRCWFWGWVPSGFL